MKLKSYIKRILNPKVAKKVAAKQAARKAAQKAALLRYEPLQQSLGYKFKSMGLLIQALTHPGAVNKARSRINSNQRLEFLGDSILQSIISDEVFNSFSDKEEGGLTKARIALTEGAFLAQLSNTMQIPEFLILPKGSENLRTALSAWEDALEAIVGAIYLDAGFETTKKVVLGWYGKKKLDIDNLVVNQNPKGSLQEAAVKRGQQVTYELVSQSGPDHEKKFEVEVFIGGASYGRATATSKKIAESKAAKAAIKKYLDEGAESSQ